MAILDYAKIFTLQTDASNFANGGLLTQEHEAGEHPVVYVSRVLTTTERNYSVTEKEALAILWSMRKLRHYLEGYEFNVITDHSSLKWLRSLKDPQERLSLWVMELQGWNFNVAYRKGAWNHVPDTLSRYLEDQVASLVETSDKWYVRRLKDVQKSPWNFLDWKVEFGVLYHKKHDELLDPVTNNEYCWRLVVPREQ